MHRDSKRCPRCRTVRAIGDFGRDRSKPDGHTAYCRACITDARERARARNQVFIAEINARTVCAHCGAQPVEWHNPEHVELKREHYRIGFLVSNGAPLAAIEAELPRCTPLCRPCHMREDGRLAAFRRNRGTRPRNTDPCADCGQPYSPLRRGLCHACNEYQRHHGAPRRTYLESVGRTG